jgi:hypothetical protein
VVPSVAKKSELTMAPSMRSGRSPPERLKPRALTAAIRSKAPVSRCQSRKSAPLTVMRVPPPCRSVCQRLTSRASSAKGKARSTTESAISNTDSAAPSPSASTATVSAVKSGLRESCRTATVSPSMRGRLPPAKSRFAPAFA